MAASASTTATAMLRQCRPCARQDQSQRAYRQQKAPALDNHMPLLKPHNRVQLCS
jgi:hypothetical protein